jgi:hypothetical protein
VRSPPLNWIFLLGFFPQHHDISLRVTPGGRAQNKSQTPKSSQAIRNIKMNADIFRYRGLIAVAVGVGVLLGAAGVFLYQEFYAEKRRMLLRRGLTRLDITVAELQNEVDARCRKSGRCVLRKASSKSLTAETEDGTDIDLQSAVCTDDDDDEFFDCSDENNV